MPFEPVNISVLPDVTYVPTAVWLGRETSRVQMQFVPDEVHVADPPPSDFELLARVCPNSSHEALPPFPQRQLTGSVAVSVPPSLAEIA